MRSILYLLFALLIFSCSSDNDTTPDTEPQPQNCQTPSAIVTDVALTEATLNFSSSSSSNMVFEYGEQGFVQGTGTIVETSQTSFTLENLEAFKFYDVYVKAICTDSESEWFGPANFMTQCDTDNGIYEGDVELINQQEVDEFGALCYSGINGDLIIGANALNDISSLLPLSNITSVNSLEIKGTAITSFVGINITNSSSFIEFSVIANHNVTNFEGIQLPSMFEQRFQIENNDSLISLEGLEDVVDITYLFRVANNDNLSSLSGLSNLSYAGYVLFIENDSLMNFEGLDSLEEIEDFQLVNTSMTSLIGLESLVSVTSNDFPFLIAGNSALTSLNGLQNILALNSPIHIGIDLFDESSPNPNPSLTDYCALQNLFTNGTYNDDVIIENNAYNPTVQDIIDGNCSQ